MSRSSESEPPQPLPSSSSSSSPLVFSTTLPSSSRSRSSSSSHPSPPLLTASSSSAMAVTPAVCFFLRHCTVKEALADGQQWPVLGVADNRGWWHQEGGIGQRLRHRAIGRLFF